MGGGASQSPRNVKESSVLLLVSSGTDQETDLFSESAVGGKEGTVPLNLTIFYNSSQCFCFHLFALGGTWEKYLPTGRY